MCRMKADLVEALQQHSPKDIVSMANAAMEAVNTAALFSFATGDNVSWKGSWGSRMTGVVEKINRKTIGVRRNNSGELWRISPGELTKEP